jgi:hypothetical protein
MACIPTMRFANRTAEYRRRPRKDYKMHVIGHQTVTPYFNIFFPAPEGYQIKIFPVIVFPEKDILSTVASLRDVMGDLWNNHSCQSWHTKSMALMSIVSPYFVFPPPRFRTYWTSRLVLGSCVTFILEIQLVTYDRTLVQTWPVPGWISILCRVQRRLWVRLFCNDTLVPQFSGLGLPSQKRRSLAVKAVFTLPGLTPQESVGPGSCASVPA